MESGNAPNTVLATLPSEPGLRNPAPLRRHRARESDSTLVVGGAGPVSSEHLGIMRKVRHALGCHLLTVDGDVDRTRIELALDRMYVDDPSSYVRLATLIIPRPKPPPDETAAPVPQGPVHFQQLIAVLDQGPVAPAVPASNVAIPPLPCEGDGGGGSSGSRRDAPDPRISESSLVAPKNSVGRMEVVDGVEVTYDVPGGNTGDALVDILGVEQAAKVRAAGEAGLVRMDSVPVVEPGDLDGG